MSLNERSAGTIGSLYALGAFGLWGFTPLFYKALGDVPPWEILANRVVWCGVLVSIFLLLRGRIRESLAALRQPRLLALMLLTAVVVGTNWFFFIWAVLNDRVLETSLGYYINPLLNVLLGALFLRERLSRIQAIAVALAVSGVAILISQAGTVPWAGLAVAGSFALYGLLRKLIQVKPVIGMQLEALLLTPVALTYLILAGNSRPLAFGSSVFLTVMLVAAGAITAVPLVFFSEAARRLKLTTVGFFQYLAPTMQFLLAVLLFGERFTTPYAIAFGFIWSALATYSLEGRIRAWLPDRVKAAAAP